ncbi:MAG TPA: tetratricopeptide repeat protein [Vicinamibacterales bacterium]|jgi:tetratricopeptide (TPR) repeat protein
MRARCLAIAVLLVAPSARAQPRVTFNKDIAPIVWSRCAPCHRPGAVAPFSLTTYDEVNRRVTLIRDVTARRLMPPWKPEPGKGDFAESRRLSDADLSTLQRWIDDGAPEGNRADLGPRPRWESGWQLGAPDLIVSMPQAYTVRAESTDGDVFRTFVLPVPGDRVRYVRAVEFRPDNTRVVHHANIGVDRTRSSRLLDAKDAEPGYSGGMVQDARYPEGQMLGWTPGQAPHAAPDGMQWRLDPGSDLVVQMHLQPTGRPERLTVSVGFYFTDQPPARTPLGLRLGSETIDIPPGASNYLVEDRFVVPTDADVLAIQPHAHNLARRMEAEAERPDGTRLPLIEITDWDFRWQDVYRYRHPVRLPKGSTISMRYTYDNSAGNPRNPHHPPARIVWGQNTSDEMGDLWLQLVPVRTSDQAALAREVKRKASAEDLAAYTKLLDGDGDNPLRHDAVAGLLFDAGRFDDAIAQYERSLALNPSSASTHYNLGIAYSARGRRSDARGEFETALRLDPDYAQAHNNLGAILFLAGDLGEAAAHYRRAIAIRPDNAEAHANFGALLSATGHLRDAVAEFRRALDLQPDAAGALSGLAWILATASDSALRNGDEAVTFAERALAVAGPEDLPTLDALAAAYAETGRFDEAVQATDRAVGRARLLGMIEVAARFMERRARYQRHEPFRTVPSEK